MLYISVVGKDKVNIRKNESYKHSFLKNIDAGTILGHFFFLSPRLFKRSGGGIAITAVRPTVTL